MGRPGSVGSVVASRYRLDAQIGSGGMGVVFRARDLRSEQDVAVKLLLPNANPRQQERALREARAVAWQQVRRAAQ